MNAISLTEFQQHCVTILESIHRSHQPVLIIDHDKVLAKVIPVFPSDQTTWLGCMADTGQITGDIVSPQIKVL
jgi:antitoxin (DNA-binding transcriptional repressor) of toxin-antitoxin stability system